MGRSLKSVKAPTDTNNPHQDTANPIWGVFCTHCCTQGDKFHDCSRYKCDYGYKSLAPPARGTMYTWKDHYAKQKLQQGEALAARNYKACHEMLGPINDAVVTDTSRPSQKKVIWNILGDRGHFLQHVPADPGSSTRGMNSSEREAMETCAVARAKRTAIYKPKKTQIVRSNNIPWNQIRGHAYDKMVDRKLREYKHTGQVTWDNIRAVDYPETEKEVDMCEEHPLEVKVSDWPGDIQKPRTVIILDNCAKGLFKPKPPLDTTRHKEGLLGSWHSTVWSRRSNRSMSQRKPAPFDKVTEPWHALFNAEHGIS